MITELISCRVFGLGFLRSCSSQESYVHFTTGMFHYYSAMESSFDRAEPAGIVGRVWVQFPELRRSKKIKQDLVDAGAMKNHNTHLDLPFSVATADYCSCIKTAALEEEPRLLGHLYVRYFAGSASVPFSPFSPLPFLSCERHLSS